MSKKEVEIEVEEEVSQEKTPRVAHDFYRDDLNDLRDAVNELYAQK